MSTEPSSPTSSTHPCPAGQGERPAELVTVRYLHTVYAPDFKAGDKGATRQLERHWAEQLVAEGYCELVSGPSSVVRGDELVSGPSSVVRGDGQRTTDNEPSAIETRETHAAAEAIEHRDD